MGILHFSGGCKSHRFAIEVGSMEALNTYIYPLCCLKSDMNSSLCKLNVQIAGKLFCLIFDALIVLLSTITAVKKSKGEVIFKSSIGPSRPVFEITISHFCRLKRLKARVIKNHMFF